MTANRVGAWLEGLPEARRRALAQQYADGLAQDGLTVYRAEDDTFLPIPPVLTPEVLSRAQLAALAAAAHGLLAATVKLARWTFTPPGAAVAARLYATFTPLEHECLRRDPARLAQIATARVDYFMEGAGAAARPRALELNATIPAMQGYSDLIAHRFVRVLARERGLTDAAADRLVARVGSNTADLLASIVAHYARAGGTATTPSIVIVSRRGDAQLGELRHYERAFSAAGHRALHVWADEITLDAEGHVRARGERFDLVYRHVFARRVDPTSPLARLLVAPGPNVVLNPVVSPLEVKGMLALLSEALVTPARAAEYGLGDADLSAIRDIVPWTRLCDPGPSQTPDGTQVPDLVAWVTANAPRLVLKRSWDYGGKSVVLGPEADGDAARARMTELFGPACRTWADLVARAVGDPGGWVVQQFVPPEPRRHLLVERDAAGAARPAWRDLYVDVSAYANLGVAPRPVGGVCRASGSRIVNILGGGGLTPVITDDVLAELLP